MFCFLIEVRRKAFASWALFADVVVCCLGRFPGSFNNHLGVVSLFNVHRYHLNVQMCSSCVET